MIFEERFWKKVDKNGPNGCWIWLGYKTPAGYSGMARLEDWSQREYPHRTAYKLSGRVIPDGYTIDHLCKTRDCVNPNHMRAVTQGENTLAGNTVASINAAKTQCIHGHEFSVDESRVRRRVCKECNKVTQQRWRDRQKLLL